MIIFVTYEVYAFLLKQINELMSALEALREKNPFIKSLVVSQFTSFLDLIAIPLRRAGFHFTRIDGRMRQADRAAAIESFNKKADDTPTVMLLSLMAGGVGLNLTGATRVFLLDPVRKSAVSRNLCRENVLLRDHYKTEISVTKFAF